MSETSNNKDFQTTQTHVEKTPIPTLTKTERRGCSLELKNKITKEKIISQAETRKINLEKPKPKMKPTSTRDQHPQTPKNNNAQPRQPIFNTAKLP
jgi:hypothetical protein